MLFHPDIMISYQPDTELKIMTLFYYQGQYIILTG